MALVFLIEVVIGPWLALYHPPNTWFYNLFIIFTVQYYAVAYYQHFRGRSLSNLILFGSILLSLASIGNYLFGQGPNQVNNFSYILGMGFITLLIILYFYDLMKGETQINLLSAPLFWLSVGILLFYSASFPILMFLNTIIDSHHILTMPLYKLVQVGNIFLSLSYIAIVLCPWISKKPFTGSS